MRLNILLLLLAASLSCKAQTTNRYKYEIGIEGGWVQSLCPAGPRGETEVSPVKFVRPVNKALGVNVSVALNEKYWLGLAAGIQEFNLGYDLKNITAPPDGGISSGLLGLGFRIILRRASLMLGYTLAENNRWRLTARALPTLAYMPYNAKSQDTTPNEYYRFDGRSPFSPKYIRYPSQQYNSLLFLMGAGFEGSLKMGRERHSSLSLAITYQQGFRSFLTDSTRIVRWPINPPLEATYWTRLNGTGISYALSYRYHFGKRNPDNTRPVKSKPPRPKQHRNFSTIGGG